VSIALLMSHKRFLAANNSVYTDSRIATRSDAMTWLKSGRRF
jgi:hypothetical protein